MEQTLIDLLFMSKKRKDVLLFLKEESKSMEEIVCALDVNATAMLPQIKKLKEQNLVVQEDKNYRLSLIGEILVEKMKPLLDTLELIEENEEYWTDRDLSAVPPHLLKRLNELKASKLIEPDPNSIFEPPKELMENIKKSKHTHFIFSFFHPVLLSIHKFTAENAEISIIITESVFERLEREFCEDLKALIKQKQISLFVCRNNLKIALLTATERFMILNFFDKRGIFDQQSMISFEPKAIRWAEDLFLHCRKETREIKE